MAEAVLFTIANKLLDTLGPLIVQRVVSSWGLKGELEKLTHNVGVIKGWLLDAEQRQHKSQAVKDWVSNLRDVLYDAGDLVDEIAVQVRMQELMTGNKMLKSIRIFFSGSNPILFNLKFTDKVKDVRARLDDIITSTLPTFNFVVHHVEEGEGSIIVGGRKQTHSFVKEEDIIGRDDAKEEIIEKLLDSEGEEDQCPSVISIVGFGGLGKTALAQLVYNTEAVKEHFEVRLWVCISEEFNVQLIIRNILRSIAYENVDGVPQNVDIIPFEELLQRFRRALEDKRYLLVLDDVWNEDHNKWVELKDVLPSSGEGSKIIVTTRSNKVADIMDTAVKHELQGLADDMSWSLFERVAFRPGQKKRNPELVDIGREIIKKCANVPLAIRTLGSLLYDKGTTREWLAIKDDNLLMIEPGENGILPVLMISYNHLPSQVKHCFAFFSLFPKDYPMCKQWLLNLWKAAGFVIPSSENQSLEDAAEDCFSLLLRRCFFQDLETDYSGCVVSFKLHDFIHDLAQAVAGKEIVNFFKDSDPKCLHKGIRYANFTGLTSTWTIPPSMLEAKHLRMFHFAWRSNLYIDEPNCDTLFTRFKYLRILDLHAVGLRNVPRSIGKLKLLVYLDLSSNEEIEFLPDSLSRLVNLQVLDLHNCQKLRSLPRGFRKLVSLLLLDISKCSHLTHKPREVSNQLPLLLEDLGHIKFTKASIYACKIWWKGIPFFFTLTGVHQVCIPGAAVPSLHVRFDDNEFDESQKLPTSIEVLEVENPEIELITSWGLNESPFRLSNLVTIKFTNCHSLEHLPPFSRLPALKALILQHMKLIEYIENGKKEDSSSEAAVFCPALKELDLFGLPNLKGWSRQVEAIVVSHQNHDLLPSFHHLSTLRISDCPNLTSMPLAPMVKYPQLNNVSDMLLQTLNQGNNWVS